MKNDEEVTRIPLRIKDDNYLLDEEPRMSNDPFMKTWDEVKNFSGIDPNFKRRAARISKVEMSEDYMDSANAFATGRDEAKSKKLNPGVVYRNAYGIFDVITPPYDVYQLAG